jgi:hypothetical protein
MPSQKCNQCDTVEQCSKYVDNSSKAVKPFPVYLCRACAKDLGFQPAKVGRPSSEALHQQAQAVEKLGLKVTEDVPGGSFAGTDADRDIRGQCLPDTIDPRGPTGK